MEIKKRGRPHKIDEKTSRKVIMRPIATDTFVAEDGTVYEKNETYSFKSRIQGLFWYKGDDGSDKKINPGSIRDDISARERKDILNSDAYIKGFIVEWTNNIPEINLNYNSLNDIQIDKIIQKFKRDKDKDEFKEIINKMDSIFAVNYFLDKVGDNLPGSLIKYCEGRLGELKEIEAEKLQIKPKIYSKDEKEG